MEKKHRVFIYKPIWCRHHSDCLQHRPPRPPSPLLNVVQTHFRRSTTAEPISKLPLTAHVRPLLLRPFIKKNRRPVRLLLTEQKTHLDLPLPPNLSCCHQICLLIGLQGGMVSMKIQGMEERTVGRGGSNNHNHTQGYSGVQKLTRS